MNEWIEENYKMIETIAKRVLSDRYGEGISAYYLHLINKDKIPANPPVTTYYFMVNLKKPKSSINYQKFQHKIQTFTGYEVIEHNEEKLNDMKMDLQDPTMIDFLHNNDNNEKWVQIYEILYSKKINLDLFEQRLFDLIFYENLSIRSIAKLTQSSPSWVYQKRKSLLEKIREAL